MSKLINTDASYHIPVLVKEILTYMPKVCQTIIDGTLWHGWHTQQLYDYCIQWSLPFEIYAFDRDELMVKKAKIQLWNKLDHIHIIANNYDTIIDNIQKKDIPMANMILLDLWVNNDHFVDSKRWFSVQYDWPLDMRFDIHQSQNARDIINTYSVTKLSDICIKYGWFTAYQIKTFVENICATRSQKPIETTTQLKNICLSSHIPFQKIPVLFQAIRIEVNQEMIHLENFLSHLIWCLQHGGRCMIITYHSIEDTIVKYAFLKYSQQGLVKHINKKVIKPTYQEQCINKKSRSAKLRIIEML